LAAQVRLSKVRRLLLRHGVEVPYSTLHRFAAVELGFGRARVTMPVADGEPSAWNTVSNRRAVAVRPSRFSSSSNNTGTGVSASSWSSSARVRSVSSSTGTTASGVEC